MGNPMEPQVFSSGKSMSGNAIKWESGCQERYHLGGLGFTTCLSLKREVKAGVIDSASSACGCWLKLGLRSLKEKW